MHRFLGNNNDGYSLIESLFQLLIFVAFVHLFVLFFYWKEPIERQYTDMTNTTWEIFAVDLQAALIDVEGISVNGGGRGISFYTSRGRIDIAQQNTMIRKTIDGLGHVPFLTNVYSAYFTLENETLNIDVTMLDGTRKERDFAIGLIDK